MQPNKFGLAGGSLHPRAPGGPDYDPGPPIQNKFRAHWLRDKAKYSEKIQRPVGVVALKYYNLGAKDFLDEILIGYPGMPENQKSFFASLLLAFMAENYDGFEPGLAAKVAAGVKARELSKP